MKWDKLNEFTWKQKVDDFTLFIQYGEVETISKMVIGYFWMVMRGKDPSTEILASGLTKTLLGAKRKCSKIYEDHRKVHHRD